MIREERPTEGKPVEEANPDDRLEYAPEAGQTDRRARRELEAGTGGTNKTAASIEGAAPPPRSWLRTVLLTLTILAMIAFFVLVFSLLSSLILL